MNSVTFIIGQLVLGGAEKQLYLLIKELKLKGWNINVITFHGGYGDYWETPIRKLGVVVYEVNTTHRLAAIKKMVAFVKANPTDIIHSWSSFTGIYALFVAMLTKTRLCVGSQRSSEQLTIRELGFLLYWLSYSGFQGITVNSRYGLKELQKRWPHKEICYIPNGIETKEVPEDLYLANRFTCRAKLNIPEDMLIIGAVGLMVQVKRFDLLIESIKILQDKSYNCGLVIIGDGPMRSQLYDKANTALQRGTYFFPGSISEASKYMSLFDIYCLTSDYEGTPNVIMEALLAGLPVVSTNVGDVKDIIENGVSGMILPSNKPQVISEHIQDLIERPDLCQKFSINGREMIIHNYSTTSMVDRMIDFYGKMEAKNGKGIKLN